VQYHRVRSACTEKCRPKPGAYSIRMREHGAKEKMRGVAESGVTSAVTKRGSNTAGAGVPSYRTSPVVLSSARCALFVFWAAPTDGDVGPADSGRCN
jgi:hypothetical protein